MMGSYYPILPVRESVKYLTDLCSSFIGCSFNKLLPRFAIQECQKKLKHRLPLGAYLLKPVQRITKYQLLLKVRKTFLKDLNFHYTYNIKQRKVKYKALLSFV